MLYKQNIRSRGQADYGENLAWNIWRVTADHTPQGSIAAARRDVYAQSSQLVAMSTECQASRTGRSRPTGGYLIVRAAVHPGIDIARIGDSKTDFFIGPEVTDPAPEDPGFYRDKSVL